MSKWGRSFGATFVFPAGRPLVPLLDSHASRVPAELRGCDCHHSRAPFLQSYETALFTFVDSRIVLN